MRVTSLELKSFRSCVNLMVATEKARVLIAGVNNVGKTGIREALKWAFTGRCEGTDGRGAGQELLVPEGAPGAEVHVTVEGLGRVSRTYTEKAGGNFTVEGFTGTVQVQHAALLNQLQTTVPFLDAALDTETFFHLHHGDAKALVLELLNVRIQVGETEYSLDGLDAAYKTAFEDRKVAKRALASSPEPVAPEENPKMPSLSQIEEQKQKIHAQLEALNRDVGQVSGTRATLESERERLRQVKAPSSEPIPGAEQLEALEQSLEQGVTPAEKSDAPPEGAQRVRFLRDKIQALNDHQPKRGCVLDGEVPCKTAKVNFTNRRKALELDLGALPSEEMPVVAPESPQAALRKRIQTIREQMTRREAENAAYEAAQTRLAALQDEIQALPDTGAQDEAVAALRSRLERGKQLEDEARRYWAAKKAHGEAVERHHALKVEVDRLEELCAALGPKGARVQALGEAMGTFEGAINQWLQAWNLRVAFSIDPWVVLINGRPIQTYSKSERFRIGVAIQLAIAKLSGLDFAVIDEMDMLTRENRKAMSEMLLHCDVGQILILQSKEPNEPLPAMAEVAAYRLGNEDGRTVILEAA